MGQAIPEEAEDCFREQQRLSAGERGTAFHKVMEHLPWDKGGDKAALDSFLEELEQRGILSREEKNSIETQQIAAIFREAVGQRSLEAHKAGKLWREQPFMMSIPYRQLDSEYTGEETVLVQGIIDLFFEEEGELVLVDYKTDRHVTAEILRERHGAQLAYYARALQAARNRPVKEVYLYSFFLGQFVAVEADAAES